MQTNSFINALRRKWGLPEFVRIRGFCSIETSQSTTTSSQHKRPSSEFHKILSLFAKRGGGLIRCCPSINVGLHNDAVLYGDAAPAPPSMPASSAASLRRLSLGAKGSAPWGSLNTGLNHSYADIDLLYIDLLYLSLLSPEAAYPGPGCCRESL